MTPVSQENYLEIIIRYFPEDGNKNVLENIVKSLEVLEYKEPDYDSLDF